MNPAMNHVNNFLFGSFPNQQKVENFLRVTSSESGNSESHTEATRERDSERQISPQKKDPLGPERDIFGSASAAEAGANMRGVAPRGVAPAVNKKSSKTERNRYYCALWRQKQKYQKENMENEVEQLRSENQVLQRNVYMIWQENMELKRLIAKSHDRTFRFNK